MDSSGGIADLTSVSFADFETKAAEGEVSWPQAKDITLDLSLGQKTLFAADQTPTPTRLIKNCDEVGLFEDLQHVNPFDIGFQRAAEQNVSGTPKRPEAPPVDGESLHTPQVFPLENASTPGPSGNTVSRSDSCSNVDVEQLLATSATPLNSEPPATSLAVEPPPLQLIQPQVFTWVLPAQSCPVPLVEAKKSHSNSTRPFILPKPSAETSKKKRPEPILVSCNTPNPEPSSASLTPTSQLPIKERLKAILHSNNLNRRPFSTSPQVVRSKDAKDRDADCMERRRVAARRYRNKVRNEHKDLLKQNNQLQQENHELREMIARLEKELKQQKLSHNSIAGVVSSQLHVPPSSFHLLINVPNIVVPSPLAKK
ncbi:cyclic AMP-dependent transcription factor ATF-2 isoform X1 [Drosophila bipectinata]|uniref:cyclic AMP-dependent transcription factor ATF-2 isoform X1 n=1 Tax=Drosophila bipectinata TaxID=42026 RepID=UPI001C8AB6B1|nr:cyclic AMP-dependent transcription factor ATF-2 [Drosophila bipectinata]